MDSGLAIETRALTEGYGDAIVAVDDLELSVRRGEVYAVLGVTPGSPQGLARVEALVEAPALYPFLSERDNLRVLARYPGVAEDRVEACSRRSA